MSAFTLRGSHLLMNSASNEPDRTVSMKNVEYLRNDTKNLSSMSLAVGQPTIDTGKFKRDSYEMQSG